MDPVTLGLCSQIDLDLEVDRAARSRPVVESDSTLLPASATENFDYRDAAPEEEELDAEKVFAKLSSLKNTNTDEDEE